LRLGPRRVCAQGHQGLRVLPDPGRLAQKVLDFRRGRGGAAACAGMAAGAAGL